MGAAGRDFHNFLTAYRDDPGVEIVAFTAEQIPGIADRIFPPDLSGPRYPQGIPIRPESELADIVKGQDIERVAFAYSDVSHEEVMHKASLVLALGADFEILGPNRTMIASEKPVVSICAVRTGVGKSGISKRVWQVITATGRTATVIRHPMPYRDLSRMAVERYATIADLDRFKVTVEEREEYEHLIDMGIVVYAGVDYENILREAEKESDVIIWDGGNNDMPFIRSNLEIVAVDPHRPGHERLFHPGEANFLRADVIVINKVDTADPTDVEALREAARIFNPTAIVITTASAIHVSDSDAIAGKRVLAIEDGPTVTHGGMAYGAAALAAKRFGAAELVDPRPYAVGSIATAFKKSPHLKDVLPAVGYSDQQLADLAATIAAVPCDVVLIGTPIDLGHVISISQPTVRVTYGIEDVGEPTIAGVVSERLGL